MNESNPTQNLPDMVDLLGIGLGEQEDREMTRLAEAHRSHGETRIKDWTPTRVHLARFTTTSNTSLYMNTHSCRCHCFKIVLEVIFFVGDAHYMFSTPQTN